MLSESITDILVKIAEECVSKRNGCRPAKKKTNLNIDIALVCRDSKQAFYELEVAGKPKDNENQLYQYMKLRSLQRQDTADHRYSLYNSLMGC